MLKEAKHVMQVRGEPRRRWFDDDYFDLIIWFEKDDSVFGFQLCYDREKKARALTWTRAHGFRHSGIDDGDHAVGGAKNSPVLIEDGLFDAGAVEKKLAAAAGELPADLLAFVLGKLKEYRL